MSFDPARARPMRLVGPTGAPTPDADSLHARFTVAPGDPVFGGHYPHFPLLPGVYLIEAAHQLLDAHGVTGPQRALAGVTDLRLSAAILPGMPVAVTLAKLADEGQQAWRAGFTHGATGRPVGSLTLQLGVPAAAPAVPAFAPLRQPVTLGPHDIVSRLAHRSPVLLVDGARVAADGSRLRAHKLVSLNEACYAGAAAGADAQQLAYPACLLVESFVQACALLVTQARPLRGNEEVMILGGIGAVRLHAPVLPGSCVRHELQLQRLIADTALIDGASRSAGRVAARYTQVLVAIRPAAGLRPPPV